MTAACPNLFLRPDTLFGVCEGLGEETGLPPLAFRLAFAVPLIFAPAVVLGTYLALGLTLMTMRWLVPPASAMRADTVAGAKPPVTPAAAVNDDAVLARAA